MYTKAPLKMHRINSSNVYGPECVSEASLIHDLRAGSTIPPPGGAAEGNASNAAWPMVGRFSALPGIRRLTACMLI